MDLKKAAALKANEFIRDNYSVGLGAGSTIAYLVTELSTANNKGLTIYTSAFSTQQLLLDKGINVHRVSDITSLDIYFDGCDQLDKNLNALKSGGGIHTREKLLAGMANQFVIVGDESKYAPQFDERYPLVIEVMPEAFLFVQHRVQQLFPEIKATMRMSNKKDGAVITEQNNYLLDCWFINWPELSTLNSLLKEITGVIETSLFYQLAHKAILAGKDGIQVLERS